MLNVTEEDLPLERVYRWEKERRQRIFLTQPRNGAVRDWTWGEAMGEARSIAAYLKAQNWEPGSRVCDSLEELRLVGHDGPRHLDVRPRNRAGFPVVESGVDPLHSGAQRRPSVLHRRDGRAADHREWHTSGGAVHCPAHRAGGRRTLLGQSCRRHAGPDGEPRPRGARHCDHHLHFRHHRDAEGCSPQVWEPYLQRQSPYSGARAAHRGPSALLPAPGHIFERAAMEAVALHAGFRVFFTESVDTFWPTCSAPGPPSFCPCRACC